MKNLENYLIKNSEQMLALMLAGESLKTLRVMCQQRFTLMVFERITEAFGNP